MNLKAQIDPELHEFIHQDRIRLFTERNEFKRLAEQNKLELNETQVRSKQVISLLLAINIVLIGVLTYVLQHT